MVKPRNESQQAPAVDFYGDASSWPMSELIHSEPLVDRSARHDWRIRPHRHNDLAQLFLLSSGSGRARLDSEWHELAAPALLVIPARVVHEFEWESSSIGYVLSIRTTLVDALTRQLEAMAGVFDEPSNIDVAICLPFITELFTEIHNETSAQRSMKDVALESMVRVLVIWLARHALADAGPNPARNRSARHFSRFTELVDEHHKSQWSVTKYASALSITPSHLNAICKNLLGKSTLDVIHERLALAARRDLAYTERNIAGVAHRLGFEDPSYFTRFFRRETGITPSEFRRRSGTRSAGAD